MSPKLLDFLKEKGISHADAMKYLEEMGKPEPKEEVIAEPEVEVEEVVKPEHKGVPLRITDMKTKEPESEEETEEEEKITLTEEELATKIALAVEEELKVKRKVPSKGKIITPENKHSREIAGQGTFERIV